MKHKTKFQWFVSSLQKVNNTPLVELELKQIFLGTYELQALQ